MERLYQTNEQRQLIVDWLNSERTSIALAKKYPFSQPTISNLKRNVDGDFSAMMKARVWSSIVEWNRVKSGHDETEQLELLGMPPTRKSILLEMIQKELDTAGDDKLERIYKLIVTA